MIEKEYINTSKQMRDGYIHLQDEFCTENNIDKDTLIDSGEWFQKFILRIETRLRQKTC